jgi:putative peptide zinc metalloprotease protein
VLRGRKVPLELVLADGTRVPITDTVTIGRAPGNTIQLTEPSVSRHHSRIVVGADVPEIEDLGSSYGTLLDEQVLHGREPLRDGLRIRLGDAELHVEAYRPPSASGRTVVVPAGASLVVPAIGESEVAAATERFGLYPRVRGGWALKRLEAGDDERRYVLKDLGRGSFARMTADDVALFERLDGKTSLHDLVVEATRRFGPTGPARLASLLADLGERGLIEGVAAREPELPTGLMRRVLRPRTLVVHWAANAFERAYRVGFVLFTRPALVLVGLVAACGLVAFVYLIAGGHATPFVVASRVGLGGLVFLLGRFVVVILHELAHGLTITSFGRRVPRAGIKVVAIFPYAFVDTSEGWFEPSRRRLAISAAGPISDVTVGGVAALTALWLAEGTAREVFFQLALAAYVGAFFNLNPLLERDGYHMLVDVLHEPGLRRRSSAWLRARLRGRPAPGDAEVLGGYAAAGLVWSLLTATFVIVISLRYYDQLVAVAPRAVVWIGLGCFYVLAFVPVLVLLYPAIAGRVSASGSRLDATV